MIDVIWKVLLVLCIMLSIVAVWQYIRIVSLNGDISTLSSELVVANVNRTTLLKVIESQNEAVQAIAVEQEELLNKYNALVAKPAEIRFKTVYEKIPAIKGESDDCKEIKDVLTSIRSAGY